MSKLILCLSVLLAVIVPAKAANLITNGNFDANSVPDGWTKYMNPGSGNQNILIEPATGYTYNSTRNLRLYNWIAWPAIVDVWQKFPVTAGHTYSLNYVWSTQWNAAWGYLDTTVWFYDASDVHIGAGANKYWTVFDKPGTNPNGTGEWKPFSEEFTATDPCGTPTSAVLHIRVALYAAVYIDNVTVVDATHAYNPVPSDLATNVLNTDVTYPSKGTKLSWSPGRSATSFDVYLGTNYDAVNNANHASPEFRGNQPDTSYNPTAPLSFGQTYYWRVDDVNTSNPSSPWKGSIWSFTTRSYLAVDDFESYNSGSSLIGNTWLNNSRASIALATAPNIATGAQAMQLNYDNSASPYYSEVYRNFSTPQNWTASSVKALAIYFHGAPDNVAESVYISLQDSGGHTATAVCPYSSKQWTNESWRYWPVSLADFTGVDLTHISKLMIGLGNKASPTAGGAGTLYVDDIRLYIPLCMNNMSLGNTNNDCIVDYQDLAVLANDWLFSGHDVTAATPNAAGLKVWYKFDETSGTTAIDSSGQGKNGTLPVDSWSPSGGISGGALVLDAANQVYVDVPTSVVEPNAHQITIAYWIKPPAGIENHNVCPVHYGNQMNVYEQWDGYLRWTAGQDLTDSILRNAVWWGPYGYSNPDQPVDQWQHYAFVKTANELAIYHNGVKVAFLANATYPIPSNATFTIGGWQPPLGGFWTGLMDDFRVYNYGLSQAEVLTLANLSTIHQPVMSAANVYNSDDKVDLKDFAKMAKLWLNAPLWP